MTLVFVDGEGAGAIGGAGCLFSGCLILISDYLFDNNSPQSDYVRSSCRVKSMVRRLAQSAPRVAWNVSTLGLPKKEHITRYSMYRRMRQQSSCARRRSSSRAGRWRPGNPYNVFYDSVSQQQRLRRPLMETIGVIHQVVSSFCIADTHVSLPPMGGVTLFFRYSQRQAFPACRYRMLHGTP